MSLITSSRSVLVRGGEGVRILRVQKALTAPGVDGSASGINTAQGDS